MHCVTSQYVFKPHDVIVLNNRISIATITYATSSQCRVSLNGMFHQDSATQCQELRIWKSNSFVSNSLGKCHLNSVWTKYVYDKSENVQVCAKWQWHALDWCYWIALPASLVVQSSNTVLCISLSFRTHLCLLAMKLTPLWRHHTVPSVPLHCCTPNICRLTYIIMMVADVLASTRCQAISNQHIDLTVTSLKHEYIAQHTYHLTYWGRDKMDAISQMTYSRAFSWMKMF